MHNVALEDDAADLKALELAFSKLRHRNEIARTYGVHPSMVQTRRVIVASAIEDVFQSLAKIAIAFRWSFGFVR